MKYYFFAIVLIFINSRRTYIINSTSNEKYMQANKKNKNYIKFEILIKLKIFNNSKQ